MNSSERSWVWFWELVVDPALSTRVSRLEASGGVRAAEAAVDADALQAAHDRYAHERDVALPPDHRGPAPHGGVGGTRLCEWWFTELVEGGTVGRGQPAVAGGDQRCGCEGGVLERGGEGRSLHARGIRRQEAARRVLRDRRQRGQELDGQDRRRDPERHDQEPEAHDEVAQEREEAAHRFPFMGMAGAGGQPDRAG